mmetsp:Transcript_189/g.423  ORF Transcript_189/g.423 Transcript_189/m.423 type:complete len:328 (+) Transcript_189:114-1097(+)
MSFKVEKQKKLENKIIFGCKKKSIKDDTHVEDIWSQQRCDDYQSVRNEVFEGTYKSAPLGRSYKRGHKLPKFMQQDTYRHGVTTSKSGDNAMHLIYSHSNRDDECNDIRNNYIISHGSYEPGQQKTRHYNWTVDPTSTTFGIKGDTQKDRGSGAGVARSLQIEAGNCGTPGNASLLKINPTEVRFGKSTSRGNSSAAQCLRHVKEDDGFDDLGKSITPGFRNIETARCFGCPSIRNDIPKYERSSVADTQNYGGDVGAADLLRPSLFASFGLDNDEFCKPRTRDYLKKIFQAIDLNLNDYDFDSIFAKVSDRSGLASVGEFLKWLPR